MSSLLPEKKVPEIPTLCLGGWGIPEGLVCLGMPEWMDFSEAADILKSRTPESPGILNKTKVIF